MSSGPWSDVILERLKIRDEIEKKDSEYYFAFQQLVGKLLLEQSQQRQQADDDEHQQSPFSSKSPSPSTVLGIENEKVKHKSNKSEPLQTTDNAAAVAKDNHLLRAENEELISNLNSITLKNEKLEAIIKEKDKKIIKLEKLASKLQKGIDNLNLEMKEKNKTIELINDENLTNQIQLNVLRDKIEKR
ncbi:ATG16 [Candida theae]|uniref:ATG16 n=1 Tax=Candida theae TaxID=1198502 RepID=A0AAD5FZT7_9ASCO|nr:ATG16 [Candida theae]KAI5963362.1 ATG16 [Candida theae]